MLFRTRKLWLLVFASLFVFWGYNLIFVGGNGNDDPIEGVSGEADAFWTDLTTIYSNRWGGITLWADSQYTTPIDLKTIISVPNRTIVSSGNGGGVCLNLGGLLVPANNEKVIFDTTKVHYGTPESAPAGANTYEFRFTTPVGPVTYH